VECGPPLRGWRDVALVMQLPAAPRSLASYLRDQLGKRDCSGGGDGDDGVFACLPGVWWADAELAAAPLFLVQDCTAPPCGAPPGDVEALQRRGVNVTFAWHDCTAGGAGGGADCGNLWAKLLLLLRAAHDGVPGLQFALKVDADTMLFPARMLAFLRTLSAAAGAHQPTYFGTHSGASATYFQGHAYGLNGEALRRLAATWSANGSAVFAVAGVPADGSGGWNEDALLGAKMAEVGAHRVHCGHFRDTSTAYVKPAGARVYPLPAQPITLHKVAKLSWRRKRQLPGALCVGAAWNCRNESSSKLRMRLMQLLP
jgi:hypothetical protein